jgi:hypothetical protein
MDKCYGLTLREMQALFWTTTTDQISTVVVAVRVFEQKA